ncbi:ABC transporter substrate-binding protein [Longirhabdus pacifica]|uniref:ABC transporter substrate-binding protein n=1 Tax=Longirhabdus pacifica TaxID=2305227 RepID=UPI0013E8CC46|nr:extracellular solute-binding protein [Longirhabdus pacifica]
MKKKIVLMFLAIMLVSSLFLSACNQEEIQDTEEGVVTVGLIDSYRDLDYYNSQFELFALQYPNVELEFVSAIQDNRRYRYIDDEEEVDKTEAVRQMLNGDNPPDVLYINRGNGEDIEILQELINEGYFLSLQSFIEEDEMDMSAFVPSVITSLKELGNGELYTLAPSFESEALIYNSDIFDEAGVSYPEDGMTWDEIFNLASQVSAYFQNDERLIYGFSFDEYFWNSDLFESAMTYSAQLELPLMDENEEQLLINNEQWIDTFRTMMKLQEEGVLPNRDDSELFESQDYNDFYDDELFMSGRTAMMLAPSYYLNELIFSLENANEGELENFNWNVVTYPVHAEAPEVGSDMDFNQLMAISTTAQNVDGAWDLVSFINGDKYAKIKSRSNSDLMSRIAYISQQDGYDVNMEAFTNAAASVVIGSSRNMDWEIENIGSDLIRFVEQEKLTLEEAFAKWEELGNEMLKLQKENPDEDTWELYDEIYQSLWEQYGQ